MRSSRTWILLGLVLAGSAVPGCGCGPGRRAMIREERGAPVQVDTRDGVRVRAPFVDIRVPPRKATPAVESEVPHIDPE